VVVNRRELALGSVGRFIGVARCRADWLVDEDIIENALADLTFMKMALFPFL